VLHHRPHEGPERDSLRLWRSATLRIVTGREEPAKGQAGRACRQEDLAGQPCHKPDGTTVRTLWGERAWQRGQQAGGAKEARTACARIAADDEKATSPGDVLRALFNEYGPCLVLIDEWVAYARELHDQSDLPGGGFGIGLRESWCFPTGWRQRIRIQGRAAYPRLADG
jgi:hypothetical protein